MGLAFSLAAAQPPSIRHLAHNPALSRRKWVEASETDGGRVRIGAGQPDGILSSE